MKIVKEILFLENERIYLRAFESKDITNEYISGLNDPEVNKYLVNVRKRIQTRETVREYVISCYNSPTTILFGIFIKNEKSNTPIGTVHISEIDLFHYSASVGICLFAKRVWKKGYAHQALILIKKYLFEILGLHYIEAGAYAKNISSANAFTRAGFSERFRVIEKYRLVDSFEEVIYFAAINPSFNISLLDLA